MFLWQKTKPINQGTLLARLGIQLIQAHLSSKPIVAGQLYKADGAVKSVDNYDDKGSKGITHHMTSVSGLSGAGIINGDGKVVGVHQHGTIENGIPDKDRFGGGIVLT